MIIGWAAALDWLGYRFPLIQRFLSPPPLTLFRNGRLNKRNMKAENITEDEIMQEVRLQGMTSLEEVDRILLEGDGEMSVIVKDQRGRRQRRDLT